MPTDPAKVKSIFLQAVENREPARWKTFLDEACVEDPVLRKEVEVLLEAHAQAGAFLETGTGVPERTIGQGVAERPGTQIGPYKLLQQIGEGGMGVVYMAEQVVPVKRRVALKIIKPGMDTRHVIARFEAERQALAMMDHPNIAKVLDAGETDSGHPYFVMELVDGLPVTKYCDEQHLTPQERLELFVPICQAVQHAHQKGIIHRDLKPSNVLVALYDNRAIPKIIDFGVAKATSETLTEKTIFTQLGQVVGTLEYMSPEQAGRNQLDVDTRSDIYSLGVLLYELLTGETPFDRERLRAAAFDEMLRVIREEEPSKPSTKVSSSVSLPSIAANRRVEPAKLGSLIRGELDWIVMKALEKDRARRYETASKFAEDVQHYLNDEPVVACPPSATYRFRKFARRNSAAILTTGVILIALMIGAGAATWQAMLATRERDHAVLAEGLAASAAVRANAEAFEAQEQSKRASSEARRAEEQHQIARTNQYIAEIVAGETEIANQNHGELFSRLITHLPIEEEEDRRDWEWFYLMSRCRPEVRTLVHRGWGPYAAWSPDGELVGSVGAIWRADSGERIRRFDTSNIAGYSCAWKPDGSKFVWAKLSDERAFYVWDRASNQITRFGAHKYNVACLAWSPDGSQIASSDGNIKIWDVNTRELRWERSDGLATTLAWRPDGAFLAAGFWGAFKVWDTKTHEVVLDESGRKSGRRSVSWHPSQNVLAKSEVDGWYLINWEDRTVLQHHPVARCGRAIMFSPDGTMIAVTQGETVTIWDERGIQKLAELNGHRVPVISVSWSPDSNRLVTGDETETIKLWDLRQHDQPLLIENDSAFDSLRWLDDDQTLIGVSKDDGTTKWWNTQNGTLIRRETPTVKPPFKWSQDRRMVAFQLPNENAIAIGDASTGAVLSTMHVESDRRLHQFAISPDGLLLAVHSYRGDDRYVDFWNVKDVKKTGTWHNMARGSGIALNSFTWSHDSRYLAAIGRGDRGDDGSSDIQSQVHVIDASQANRIIKWNPRGFGNVTTVAWSRDDRFLALGTHEGRIEITDVAKRHQVLSKKLHRNSITALAWHPRGNRLACATEDGSIKLLTAAEGRVLLSFAPSVGASTKLEWSNLAWSNNGHRLAAATTVGRVHVWDAGRAYEFSPEGPRPGELAWMYFNRAEGSPVGRDVEALREVLRFAPDTLDFWKIRGTAYVYLGEFAKAAQEFAKGTEPMPQYAFSAARDRSYALLATGDLECFSAACVRLIEVFHDSPVPSNQGEIAWLCSLAGQAEIDTEQLVKMARTDYEMDGDGGKNVRTLRYGACLFRNGQLKEASQLLSELTSKLELSNDVDDLWLTACGKCFLSLGYANSGQPIEAQRMLRQANQLFARYPRTVSYWNWVKVIAFDTLQREAQTRLEEDESSMNRKKPIESDRSNA